MVPPEKRGPYMTDQAKICIKRISDLYGREVLYYASGFLQKPMAGMFTNINMEDIDGFMAGIHKHDFSKGLLLIMHTPGGMGEAAHTIVDYLRTKFSDIDFLVPTYAMSAGTMIALGCDRIIMGGHSQLGPTDPQLFVGNGAFSAHSIVEQFREAKNDIVTNPVSAHAWAPILRSFGPALVQEARKSIKYGQTLVQEWLEKYMFSNHKDPKELAKTVAEHFGGNLHGSHGKRIDREEARRHHLKVIDLENDQKLQDEVLTLYHMSSMVFDFGPAAKTIVSSNGTIWVKNWDP